MKIFYNASMVLLDLGLKAAALWRPKERLMVSGRRALAARVREAVKPGERICWFHASSVGEFEQARPLIEAFRSAHPEFKILLTFFSSSGYELRKSWKGADYVFYIPIDRPRAVREFLDAVKPEIVYIIKYEFWLNLLSQLRQRKIRTFLVSAAFRKDSVFFKPWGGEWRKALSTYETIFVQNQASADLLAGIGIHNAVIAGDTRFDRVRDIVRSPISLPLVEKFCGASSGIFVAGSTWGPDEEILVRLMNDNPSVKFIVAPHEMSEARIGALTGAVHGGSCRYSCPESISSDCRLLVIDTVGILSSVYRYASWAYVGGGFGAGIHNTVEPASYGLPIAFGPKYRKFSEAVAMVSLGIARSVGSYEELAAWFAPLCSDESLRRRVCAAALAYTESQIGATQKILA